MKAKANWIWPVVPERPADLSARTLAATSGGLSFVRLLGNIACIIDDEGSLATTRVAMLCDLKLAAVIFVAILVVIQCFATCKNEFLSGGPEPGKRTS